MTKTTTNFTSLNFTSIQVWASSFCLVFDFHVYLKHRLQTQELATFDQKIGFGIEFDLHIQVLRYVGLQECQNMKNRFFRKSCSKSVHGVNHRRNKESHFDRPFKGMKVGRASMSTLFLKRHDSLRIGFGRFTDVQEGLGTSARLVGFTSTYPGTSPTSCCQLQRSG